ncbi:DoxX family protein [Paenibacillus sp. SC116]|uniref:DoxX family protein n=1 Tax=Paenibacillus sp. SC116 TaxID=2968986 RepID=UPI00215A2018|nr:DoxX family protein [Paenibacillus sp. SC116]MCR8844017.1 DoxX family protein [Paenibacillus sp. SC116]
MNATIRTNVVATIMRVILGVIFTMHGLDKLQMGLGNTAGWFESIGLPGTLAYVVALIELLGGIAMIVGLLTRFISIGYVAIMIGAIVTVKLPGGLIGPNGYELDLALLALAIYFIFAEHVGYGVDQLLFRKKSTQE